MSVVFEPEIKGGEIKQWKPSFIDIYKSWKQKYDAWLKGEGKTIEEGERLKESKTGLEQAGRILLGSETVDVITSLDPLKQITRIAVILIVAMVGIMTLLQVMQGGKGK